MDPSRAAAGAGLLLPEDDFDEDSEDEPVFTPLKHKDLDLATDAEILASVSRLQVKKNYLFIRGRQAVGASLWYKLCSRRASV